MKTRLLLLFLATASIAYGNPADKLDPSKFSSPEKIIITGKAKNLNAGTTDLEVILFPLNLPSETLLLPVDAEGNFRVECETYAPIGVSFRTPTMLSLTAFPGDSIHAEFDGTTRDRTAFYDNLQITGDHARFNKDQGAFFQLLFPDPVLMDYGKIFGAMKEYTPDEFFSFLDTLQMAGNALYDRFVETCDPCDEAKILARSLVDLRYADFLGQYISGYMTKNTHYGKVELPSDISEKMIVPLTEQMILYNGSSVDTYTNRMHFSYAFRKVRDYLMEKPQAEKDTLPSQEAPEIMRARYDSLVMRKLVEFTPGPLLKQLVLMEDVQQKLDNMSNGIEYYEKNLDFIDEVITLPYLRASLHDYYLSRKIQLENPVLHTEAILKQMEGSSAGEIVSSILEENKGKIVYIDVWATWCGPCKSEMPYSRKLMQEMEGRDVVFVYICIDSNEPTWKADLDKLELSGLQYFLDREQSAQFRQAFEINGIPEYLLFDREGTLTARKLRPSGGEIRTKINELLK